MRSIPSIRSLIFALVMLGISAAYAQVGISVTFAPPELPVYEQPLIPGEGYIWTPGYWAWSDDDGDYYWVPGTWVMAPEPGLLWTPAYWGWEGNAYVFHEGYWAPQVGFYGGISYGYGYTGAGYEGGRWQNGQFYYNQSVNNVNVTTIRTVYNTPVNNTTVSRVSYNGGNGGVNVRPNASTGGCGTSATCSACRGSNSARAGCSLPTRTTGQGQPRQATGCRYSKSWSL